MFNQLATSETERNQLDARASVWSGFAGSQELRASAINNDAPSASSSDDFSAAFVTINEREPNNTPSQAQSLNVSSDTFKVVRGSLSSSDRVDIYRLDTNITGRIDIQMRSDARLTAPNRPIESIVSLYQDVNRDNVLTNDELVKTDVAVGTDHLSTLTVNGTGAGRYFIRIERNSTTQLPYEMTVDTFQTGPGSEGVFETDVGRLVGKREFRGSVSTTDTRDDYRFSLAATKNVRLSLSDPIFGGTNDANLVLFRDVNNNGQIDSTDQFVATSVQPNTMNERIERTLASGNYIARVSRISGANQFNYNFSLEAR